MAPIQNCLAFIKALMAMIALLLVWCVWRYFADPRSLRRFPAPSIAAFTPLWMIWQNAQGRRTQAIEDAHRRLGPVVRIGPNSISFCDPLAYKEIYGHGASLIKDVFYDNLAGETPSMADTSSRALHSTKRKNVSNIFSSKNITAMEHKVKTTTAKLLAALKVKSTGGAVSDADKYQVTASGEFDLRPWMNMFSFDAFTSMLWSASYGFLDRGSDDCKSMDVKGIVSTVPAMGSFQDGVHFSTLCAQLGPLAYRVSRVVTSWMNRSRAAEKFTGMARHGVVTRLQRSCDEIDFFSFFPHEATEKRPVPMSTPELVAECASFLNAGNDTTQITLTNTMFQLASHPAQQEKLFNLLKQSLPEEDQPISSHSELRNVPYLAACIDETLRIMPAVRYGLPRRTVGEDTIIRGHPIRGGVTVSASVQTMQRDESLFFKAKEWIPERWMSGFPDALEDEPKNLRDFVLPFTLGGRACIGRNLAYMELSICIAAMILEFEWKITKTSKEAFSHFERFNTSPVNLMITATPRTE